MLKIANLAKSYRSGQPVLSEINLDIEPGIWGLLGPNGAGKSTLMKIVSTLLTPDRGRVWFNGIDVVAEPKRARHVIGYLPQEYGFYASFTAFQMLEYFAVLKDIAPPRARRRRVAELLEQVNLAEVAAMPVGDFSTGMRQRLGVAQALLAHPTLLIVDEPTAGLDPEERLRLHNLLAAIGHDVVVILSTHIVSDVAALCSRFSILHHGQIVADTTPGAAVTTLAGKLFEGTVPLADYDAFRARWRVLSRLATAPHTLRLKVYSDDGPPTDAFVPATGTLEDVYFQVVGESAGRA
jgi:ABC-type multidrug transport system ATPase subunit